MTTVSRCGWMVTGLALLLPLMVIAQTVQVAPTVETDPVPSSGDAADDPAIWIHPTVPSLSLILGTNKRGSTSGLAVYDLSGTEVQYIASVQPNNVDLRYNFPLGNDHVDIVGISNQAGDVISIFKVNPDTRRLEDVTARDLDLGISAYGFCLYHSPVSGKYYAIVTSDSGKIEQWELFDNGQGKVDAVRVRSLSVGSRTEGCVADDVYGVLYVAEEDKAIWKYGAEPGDGSSRTQVDAVSAGRLNDDIEGLTIYYGSAGTGYLIASSQGNKEFVVYRREGNNAYVMTFKIVDGNGIDGVVATDGIDVANVSLGSAFPSGVFVAQDGANDSGNQNFKLVPWEAIANAVQPRLTIDTTWDPRAGEGGGSSSATLVVTSFTPTSGIVGDLVTLNGQNFTDDATVAFNGTAALDVSVDTASQIIAVVPQGATTGPVSVTTPEGTGVSATDFNVVAPPQLTAFTPTSGPVGTPVVLSGSNFTADATVTFDGLAATAVSVDTSSQITAVVPAGFNIGFIEVTTPYGTNTSATAFIVTAPPPLQTFLPTDDAQVKSSSPKRNYGTLSTIRLRDESTTYVSYLQFAVSGLAGVVQQATLRLYVTDASKDGGAVYVVSNTYAGTSTPWRENELTWNNAPGFTGNPVSMVGAVREGTWVEFDVTAAISGNGIYSFGLRNASSNSVFYSSKEGSHPPELLIETTP